ncbi:hypothetical protein V8C40DRAFT_102665 [Trichoderma camerunense]
MLRHSEDERRLAAQHIPWMLFMMNFDVNIALWLAERKQALHLINRNIYLIGLILIQTLCSMKQKKTINANRHKANFTQKQLAKRKRERKEKVSQPVQTDHQSHYSCSPK